MVDFSLLQTPNFAQVALGAAKAGAALGREKRRNEALAAFRQTGDVGELERSGDADLMDMAGKRREAEKEARKAAALGAVFGGGQPALGAGEGAPVSVPAPAPTEEGSSFTPDTVAAAPVAPTRPDGLEINWRALREYAALDPDGAVKLADFASKADKARLEQVQRHGETKAQFAFLLRQMPAAQRASAFEAMKPDLIARGFGVDELAQARLDDASLDKDIAFGLTVKDMLGDARAARSEARTEQRAAAADARAERADGRAAVRFGERDKDRAAIAAGGRNADLNYLLVD